ncbi:MAG: hypothetical protein VXW22_11755 [Pseudomonadota bacterium]|nr:hypothetical protein [Pseudomonadota bacterium]
MIKLNVEIGDLPALSYAIAKGREGITNALAFAVEEKMSDGMQKTLTKHLAAIDRLEAQLNEGKVV